MYRTGYRIEEITLYGNDSTNVLTYTFHVTSPDHNSPYTCHTMTISDPLKACHFGTLDI